MVYSRRAHPRAKTALVRSVEDYAAALADASVNFVAVRADDAHLISAGRIGLAVNTASMQEMNPATVAEYFSFLRAAKGGETLFYCCNRAEKTLPDGTRVEFEKFPWRLDDEILLDGLCPWHQKYYRPWPPFYRPYDGPIRHRLARFR